MIKEINIIGFKCFENENLILAKSNLLLGSNSSGKSTFIQAILLSKMLIENNKVDLNNNFYNLNLISFNEVINSESEKIEISLIFENNKSIILDCYSPEEDHLLLAKIEGDISLFKSTKLTYLSAERIINQEQTAGDIDSFNLGDSHEHLAYYIEKGKTKKDLKYYPHRNHWMDPDSSLIDFQINSWLDYILPGNNVMSSYIYDNKYNLQFGKFNRRQTNVGFGVSYILPIIAYGLMLPENSILIIENPELHLHPSAQSKISEFLNVIASNNIQIIIETHSDHIVNGFRKSTLKPEVNLSTQQMFIYYFSSSNEDEAKKHIELVNLTSAAEITQWPDGFMDQLDEDLMEMRNLRKSMRHD
ncbi:DUF3696 domain-containing protein [Exiguobacterium profundum]|uniref:DUF3696 domain-containing protein n=1 Tax=Exiguobacterium profundum TaxID=307643 RepID=UPI003393A3A9